MRSMRLAALAVAMTLAFSGLALASDHDNHWKDKHVEHHHQVSPGLSSIWNHNRNGSNSSWSQSAREREREHARWEHRNNGSYGRDQVYNRYPNGGYGYPGNGGYGYPNGGYGYPGNGGYGYPNGGYGYPGNGGYGRGGYGNGSASGSGYRQGMQDGSYQARKDVSQNKPFNPNPRGASHSDHGYNSSMGDKHAYQASYDQGYRSGYQANYGGGRAAIADGGSRSRS